MLKFSVNILLCKHYFGPLNTFIRKGKDPEPDSVPYLSLTVSGFWRAKNMRIRGPGLPDTGIDTKKSSILPECRTLG